MRKSILSLALVMCAAMFVFQSCEKEVQEPGTLKGEFSVSPTQKVKFSSGNLQYNIATKIWKFADNQWDALGSQNNQLISDGDKYTGSIDLFAIGSADDPTLRLCPDCTFTDWGKNPISNAANTPNEWRTLSEDEWKYLIAKRPNAFSLMFPATVNGIKGIVLLPDDFENKDDLKVYIMKSTDFNDYGKIQYVDGEALYAANTYTVEEFKNLEKVGVVFLPFAGCRVCSPVANNNMRGLYWSSDENGKKCCDMDSEMVFPFQTINPTDLKLSVRLVKDVVSEK